MLKTKLKSLFLFNILLFSSAYAQLDPTHSNLTWALGIEDSLTFRNRQILVGTGYTNSQAIVYNFNSIRTNIANLSLRLGYEDIYSLFENNPYGFVNYRSVQVFMAKSFDQTNRNLADFTYFNYGIRLLNGIGYNLENYYVIPYSLGGTLRSSITFKNYENQRYSKELDGINSEIGVIIRCKGQFGIRLGYSTAIYSAESNNLRRYATVFIESGMVTLTQKIIHVMAGESKFYPVINIVGQAIIRFVYASLRRTQGYYPFNSANAFTINKFQIGFAYEINL